MKTGPVNKVAFNSFLKVYKIRKTDKKRPTLYKDSGRHCPVDGTALQPLKVDGTIIDWCSECCGIWFDYGELQHLLSKDSSPKALMKNMVFNQDDDNKTVLCPKCHVMMGKNELPHSNRHIDICRSCGGIWLDGGEFMLLYKEAHEKDTNSVMQSIVENFFDLQI